MATVDVLTERVATQFENGKHFLATDKAVIAASGTSSNGAGIAPAAGTEIAVDRFPLEDDSFVNLQVYLKAALRLPSSQDNFKLAYPEKLFETYTKKDTASPSLYDFMSTTLVGIHQRCYKFQIGTMNSMVTLAGNIATFSSAATTGADKINANFEIICKPGASFDDPKVREAADSISNTLEILQTKATKAKGECKATFDELGQFKTDTGIDKTNLKLVTDRSAIVLPTMADLNKDMRDRADIAYNGLNALAKQQNAARQQVENKSGVKWYYFIPWVGWGLAIADTVSKNSAENALKTAQTEFQTVFNSANETLKTSISFRETCRNLNDNMQTVQKAIEKAEGALQSMMGAFSNMQTNLGDIATDLDMAKGKVVDAVPRKRKAAMESLQDASKTWAKVTDLASRFQARGLVMEKNVNELDPPAEPYPWLEIVSSNYGGKDVSDVSKVLFNYGDSIRVRSVEPGFEEPWKGVVKSIVVLHQLGKSQRIFACREYTGTHIIEPKKNIGESNVGDAELHEVSPLNAPAGAKAKILAITWGAKEVRSQAVYDYCYGQLNTGNIEWSNDRMGGDTWSGTAKSGVIFYSVGNGTTIYQCTGHERGDSTPFKSG